MLIQLMLCLPTYIYVRLLQDTLARFARFARRSSTMQSRRESHGSLATRPVIQRPSSRDRSASTSSTLRAPAQTNHPDGPVADETTALLAKQVNDDDDERVLVQTSREAMVLLLKSAAPMVVGFLLEAMLTLSATAIAGRLDHIALGIVGNGELTWSPYTATVPVLSIRAQVISSWESPATWLDYQPALPR